jgi:mannose-1-phosphate guanylyltransferase
LKFTSVIPAGGEGSRFKPYTDIVPKPMIPLGEEEKPILDYIVQHLSSNGSDHIILLVNYKWKYIKNYFRDGDKHNVKIDYSIDDNIYGNTGGSLLKAYKEGLLNSDIALIWYGDIIAGLNPKEVIDYHIKNNTDVTLVIANKYQIPVGVAEIDENNNIIKLNEKPWLDIKVTIGILTLRTSILENIEEVLGTKFDIMGDLIPYMIKKNLKIKGFIYDKEWLDVGSLERYKKIDSKILNKILS